MCVQWRCDVVPALTASTMAGLGADNDNTTLVHAGDVRASHEPYLS